MCSDRDGNRLAIAAHQVQHHIAAWRYFHLAVQGERTGQAVDRQNASAHGHAGIITVADLNDIAGNMSQSFGPHGKIHRLRFQQFGGDGPQSGAVRLPPAGTGERVHLQDVATVAPDGSVVFHQFGGRFPAVVRVGVTDLGGIVALFQCAEAVDERRTVSGHHHITLRIGPDFIGGPVLHKRQGAAVPDRHAAHQGTEIPQHVPRLTLVRQIRIAGDARLCPAEAVRHGLITILRDGVQRPLVHIGNTNAASHAIARVGQHIQHTPGWVICPGGFECPVPESRIRPF